MIHYVALLRGINVGGKNPIPMAALVACVEAAGLQDVATYIQSGNVLFRSSERSRAGLRARIEEALAERFDYRGAVFVRSREQLRRILAGAPAGFGTQPASFRYDVLFLKEPLTGRQAVASVPTRTGVDEVHAGPGVLNRLVSLPIYREMTVRNWNTTTTLLRLMEQVGRERRAPVR